MKLRKRLAVHSDVKFKVKSAVNVEQALAVVHAMFLRSLSDEVNVLEAATAEKKRPVATVKPDMLYSAAENVWKKISKAKKKRTREETVKS